MKPLPLVVGILTAIVLSLGTWTVSSVSSDKTDIADVKARTNILEKQLERIENKVDRLLERQGSK